MVGNDLLMHTDGFIPKSSCSQLRWEGVNVIRTSSPYRVPNPQPMGRMWPRMAMNEAQHKIVNFLKTLRDFLTFISVCILTVWPETTLLPVWPRDAKRWDTPVCTGPQ